MTASAVPFVAEAGPSEARVAGLSALDRENPFATRAYAAARESMNEVCWLLGLDVGAASDCLCFGFLRSGRVNRVLEIPSLPGRADARFYDGLLGFCNHERVTVLDINTFASSAVDIPRLPREFARRERAEWLMDLTRDWRAGISTNHRRNIMRARKLSVTVCTGEDAGMLDAHCSLVHSGAVRRRAEAGEDGGAASAAFQRLIDSLVRARAGRFVQVVHQDRVLASAFVLVAERAGYYHSSGTSDEGRESGAAHLLIETIAEMLHGEGKRTFNLGGAGADNPGLVRFKSGFGARVVPSAAVRARPFSLRSNPIAAAVFYSQRVWAALR